MSETPRQSRASRKSGKDKLSRDDNPNRRRNQFLCCAGGANDGFKSGSTIQRKINNKPKYDASGIIMNEDENERKVGVEALRDSKTTRYGSLFQE